MTEDSSAGNGSIMRLAPIPMYYSNNPEDALKYSALSSKTTHANVMCIDACRYMSGIIVGLLNGDSKVAVLSSMYSPVKDYIDNEPLCDAVKEVASGSFKDKQPPDIKGTGFIIKSLEAALWAFYTTNNFKDGALKAVNLGDDADTTGAVYGQIAGACYDIPQEWLDVISMREKIMEISNQLFLSQHSY